MEVYFQDICASIEVSDHMSHIDILWLQMYTAAIHAFISKLNKFTDGMACAIYGDKHTFDKC